MKPRKWWQTFITVLDADLPEHGLIKGDIGNVVLVHPGGEKFDVEFVTLKGELIAVVTLDKGQIREVRDGEVGSARRLTVPVDTRKSGRRARQE